MSLMSPLGVAVAALADLRREAGMTALETALMGAKPNASGQRIVSLPLREGVRLFAVFGAEAFIQVYVQVDRPFSPTVAWTNEEPSLTARLLSWRLYADLKGWIG